MAFDKCHLVHFRFFKLFTTDVDMTMQCHELSIRLLLQRARVPARARNAGEHGQMHYMEFGCFTFHFMRFLLLAAGVCMIKCRVDCFNYRSCCHRALLIRGSVLICFCFVVSFLYFPPSPYLSGVHGVQKGSNTRKFARILGRTRRSLLFATSIIIIVVVASYYLSSRVSQHPNFSRDVMGLEKTRWVEIRDM